MAAHVALERPAEDKDETARARLGLFSELGEDLLALTLSKLDQRFLSSAASLVNRTWLRLAGSQSVWQSKFASPLSLLQAGLQPSLEPSAYVRQPWPALWHGLYETNLAQNFRPLWHEAFMNHGQVESQYGAFTGKLGRLWRVTKHGGHGWRRYLYCDPIPRSNICNSPGVYSAHAYAITASYQLCEMLQEVNLVEHLAEIGFGDAAACAYLDSSPPMRFSVWYGQVADHGGLYEIEVILDRGDTVLPHYRGSSTGFIWARKAIMSWSTGEQATIQGRWREFCLNLESYPAGVRRAIILLRGQDCEGLAGHYGAQFAAPELCFKSPVLSYPLGRMLPKIGPAPES